MRQERLQQFVIPSEYRRVQRRVTGVRGVWVRPLFQQKRPERGMTAVRRHHEGARAGWRRIVGVRAGVKQQPRRLDVPVPCRKQQRRVSTPVLRHHHAAFELGITTRGAGVDNHSTDARAGADIGAMLDQ